ncbi:MAG: SWIM zinc finger family protein [Chloroflexi bacterium]|nr:SWIM zinc finger family protein [Chloroflexota bacterium]
MYSSVISKIEKAKRYAEEKERVTFDSFVAEFKGENDDHKLEYSKGNLACSCLFFVGHDFCSHSLALQRILEGMIPVPAGHALHPQ